MDAEARMSCITIGRDQAKNIELLESLSYCIVNHWDPATFDENLLNTEEYIRLHPPQFQYVFEY